MITTALVGNPNVGKTTLFNALTGSNQYVGNWAGVTVEKKEGFLSDSIKIVDLPGIYAMDTFSNEEKISKKFIESEDVDLIINIVDASNLSRNLYLTTQLKQFNKPILLILNMCDVADKKGLRIDYKSLEDNLKVKVLPITATKSKGIDEVKKIILSEDFNFGIDNNNYSFSSEEKAYKFIDNIISKSVDSTNKVVSKSLTNTIDKVLLNPWLAYPMFLLVLFLMFKLTFSWIGQPLTDLLADTIDGPIKTFMEGILSSSSPWFSSLIVEGIIAGVGSVISFIPLIFVLFFCISFLEDSGYMSRAAFIMDRFMRKIGLSGKAFIPFIVGFGCSVPAIMSSRTLESEKDRKMTALLAPLMSCNARLPVYATFAGAFFAGNDALVIISLYLLGIIMALIVGLIFKNTLFKKDEEPFIIELPEYKIPELKSISKLTWEKGKEFIKKAGTIIFAMSIIIWFLSHFSTIGYVEDVSYGFLANIGSIIAPIFAPLGFGQWQASVALLTGIVAKESVLATMGVIYGGDLTSILPQHFSTLSSYAFMVFVLLYTPCMAVIGAMKKEYGAKFALFSVTYQFVLAWIVSFLVFNIGGFVITLF